MINCNVCQFNIGGYCWIDPPTVVPNNASFSDVTFYRPKVKATDGCPRGERIPEGSPTSNFEEDFQYGWHIQNSPFDIIGYENFDTVWFEQHDFGDAIFVEDFEGVWD